MGHITLDKVVTSRNTVHIPRETSLYFSHVIKHFDDINYTLVAALAGLEMKVVEGLRVGGIDAAVMPNKYTAYLENIYEEDQDSRTQRALAKADPFTVEYLEDINSKILHLDSLLVDSLSLGVVKYLAGRGLISISSQGYPREVGDKDVPAVNWSEKREALKYVRFLEVNEHEMEVSIEYTNAVNAGKVIYDWGVREVLLTFGNIGSIIYDGSTFHKIPTYIPREVVDTVEAGDTYMAEYLYKRAEGANIEEAGRFAAAMITLKIEGIGPFNGTKEDVL